MNYVFLDVSLSLMFMGHRIGKAISVGCIRQSAVRSSVKVTTPVVGNGHCHTIHSGNKVASESTPKQTSQTTHHRNVSTAQLVMSLHVKARCEIYPRTTDVKRFTVPDDMVPWSAEFLDYDPENFTSKTVLSQPDWADRVDPTSIIFNCVDESCEVDRRSYGGDIEVCEAYPRNPRGRTGVIGRGSLGRWGPNHAADPIVTRWKRHAVGNDIVVAPDGKPVLQFVAVQRQDCGEWALPGGMVNPSENRTVTLMREFGEEALNSLEATDEEKIEIDRVLKDFFKDGFTIYKGYVDDPRNTDNAWMETKAMNFHDNDGKGVGAFKLHAGDDAAAVQWMDIDSKLKLYASHIDFIKATVEHLKAYW